MEAIIYSPPIIFILFLLFYGLSSKWFSKYSNTSISGQHTYESYACGQRDVENYVNPDYSQYYPYAFAFTIVHILILVVATAPSDARLLPIIYIISGILAILIAFRR